MGGDKVGDTTHGVNAADKSDNDGKAEGSNEEPGVANARLLGSRKARTQAVEPIFC